MPEPFGPSNPTISPALTDNEMLSSYSDIFYNQEPVFLYHWNEQANLWSKYYQTRYPKIFSKDINDIYRVDDILYIATDYGLLIYQIKLNKWITLNASDGLPDNVISKIEYYDDMIYLATMSGLVTVSIKTNNLIDTYFHSLHNGEILDMIFSDQYLYLVERWYVEADNVEIGQYTGLTFFTH